jgi:hypothetical protein
MNPLNPFLRAVIGLVCGLATGATYSYFVRCQTAYCTANDTPAVPILVCGAIGVLVAAGSKP